MTERKWPPDDNPRGHRPAGSAHALPTSSDAPPDPGGAADSGGAAASAPSSEDHTQLLAENAELKDRLLRALAEVENTRRRAERDLDNMRQYAITKFAGDMLIVADNLERAIASIPASVREPEAALRTLVEGVGLTEKELLRALEKHGISKLDPVGERFDPNLHEALFEVPDPSVPRGTVMKVLQPGYAIGSRALRPAKVGIASGA
ncbi:nucleotide exchange factor GrpE [Bradyrhizobium erythrophlei]|uniref:Protein GrpE n=1 Tax=Bradyrhizobium erythrophlei TaxID=1437360 RepID=A0A1H5D3F3_9BRAD|nr:nucleotide exchange factor GrpE [Bradyrhizobium erythrophlei]SED73403.1 molecular chaperone GrpE [Bradyrhizobium erythrophlei]